MTKKNLATTRMSSRGQVVIPETIRERLALKEGAQFVVLGEGDAIILKIIEPPSMEQFKPLLATARRQAKKAKLKKTAVQKIIRQVRKQK